MIQTRRSDDHAARVACWREALQLKLMAALDAAWAAIETEADPQRLRAARDRAKACGDLAACARKVAALTLPPTPRKRPAAETAEALIAEADTLLANLAPPDPPVRKLDRLKGGRRGRL